MYTESCCGTQTRDEAGFSYKISNHDLKPFLDEMSLAKFLPFLGVDLCFGVWAEGQEVFS